MSMPQNPRFLFAKVCMFYEQKEYKSLCFEPTIVTKTFAEGEKCLSIRKQLKRACGVYP